MFRGLRLRLTLIYSAAALALMALVGGGVYLLLDRYFRQTTDQALQHKMVHEFYLLAAPLPADLAAADRDWSVIRGVDTRQPPLPTRREEGHRDREHEDDDQEGQASVDPWAARQADLAFNAELAAIFVMPLDASGNLLFDPNITSPPIPADKLALATALTTGSDLRTITDGDGQRIRLMTYRLTSDDGPAALQLGRVLGDQEQIMGQMLTGILALSAIGAVLIGGLSWWLAGRALHPAQVAWDRQQVFIAGASHELRTPLTLLRASAEVALRATPTAQSDQRELLGDVLRETDHMSYLVDDLLTLTRLDAGRLPLEQAEIDLPAVLGEVGRQVGRLAAERGLTLSIDAPPARAFADPTRLRQVLLILLDNALRHTPPDGAVTVAVRAKGEGRRRKGQPDEASYVPHHGSFVQIDVCDTGTGIAPEHLPHIFDRFYRADQARGAAGNAGLGLAIAQGLVHAMGGQIGAESAPGRGTTVWLTLPAAP